MSLVGSESWSMKVVWVGVRVCVCVYVRVDGWCRSVVGCQGIGVCVGVSWVGCEGSGVCVCVRVCVVGM